MLRARSWLSIAVGVLLGSSFWNRRRMYLVDDALARIRRFDIVPDDLQQFSKAAGFSL